MKLEDYIVEISNCLSPHTISRLLRYINSDITFKDAETVGGTNKKVRNALNYSLMNRCTDFDKSMTEIFWYNLLEKTGLETATAYKNITNTDFGFNHLLEVTILKYEEGGFYVPHVDDGQQTPRVLSGILFLNNDYEGGELWFYTPDKKEVIKKIKPEVGKYVWWPSTALYPHAAQPVIKGTRYVVVTWT